MADWSELRNLCEKSVSYRASGWVGKAEVNPERILALLDELEACRVIAEHNAQAFGQVRAENERLRERKEEADGTLRSLACQLGAGGYNADEVDPKVFGEKISWGIDALVDPISRERDQLRAEVEALRASFGECIDSLHAEMREKFGGQLPGDMHPVTRRDYDRDMAEIAEYRAAMSKGEQDNG